jgi:hypothetical protein
MHLQVSINQSVRQKVLIRAKNVFTTANKITKSLQSESAGHITRTVPSEAISNNKQIIKRRGAVDAHKKSILIRLPNLANITFTRNLHKLHKF